MILMSYMADNGEMRSFVRKTIHEHAAAAAMILVPAGSGCAKGLPPTWQYFEEKGFAFRAPPGIQKVPSLNEVRDEVFSYDGSGMYITFNILPSSCPGTGDMAAMYQIQPIRVSGLEGHLAEEKFSLLPITSIVHQSVVAVTLPPPSPGGKCRCFLARVMYRNALDQGTATAVLRSVVLRGEAGTLTR